MSTSPLRRRYRSHLLSLEPRMMFDAAAAVTMQNLAVDQAPGEHAPGMPSPDVSHHDAPPQTDAERTHSDSTASADMRDVRTGAHEARTLDSDSSDTSTRDMSAGREIIFVDTSVDDYQQLAAEWAGRGEVILIDGTRDGIDQVRAALAGQTGISAIHIVSHGVEGAFWLGTTKIDEASINGDLAASLGAIGRSLSADGDILIYGCDFAEGADGARALEAFARATDADVAASTDTTGFAPRGGDWLLEANRGTIEARALSSDDYVHTLDPNTPVPISVTADSLTVTNGSGTVVVSGSTGYGNDARSPDVGVGSVAVWAGAATFQGKSVDLKATVVSLSSGDAVRFNRPTGGNANNGDDATFLLRDLTSGASAATIQIRWELVDHATGQPLAADVRFTVADIDGIGGNPNTRETVTASTQNLAYYTRDANSDIHFNSTLNSIEASGTQDENNPVGQTLTPKSAASFDWSKVSAFTLTYTLTPNSTATQAQFYHDGDADFVYNNPVYVSVPRLDLDGNDSTASGTDAHFTFTENGPGVPVVDSDVVVTNPMGSIVGATVTLTNYKAGDAFTVGALPANLNYSIGAVSNGTLTLSFTGAGTEADYRQALLAVRYANSSDTPDPAQRSIQIAFSNDTLTSATATSRIDVVPVNDPPVAVDDTATVAEDGSVTIAVLTNDSDPENDALTITAASALHGTVTRTANGTIDYTPNANYNGPDTITYTISDGNGGTASAKVAVTVQPVNDAPTPVGTIADRSTQDAAQVSYATAGNFNDIDGDTLTYSATGLPSGLTIDAATGVISGTVNRSASQSNGGSYAVQVTARDRSGTSARQDFTITVTNPAPTAANDSVTTQEDRAVTIAVLGNDVDPDGDPLTVTSASAQHGTVVRNANGTLTYTPNANYNGSDTIAYAISDGEGGTSNATVAVTITAVNDAPTPVGTIAPRSNIDGGTDSFSTASFFTDVEGDTLTYSATGLPAGLTIDAASGVVSGTINRSASQPGGGRYTSVITARDPSGGTGTQSFAYTVTNPAPTAQNDSATTAEDTPVTIAVLANDSDPDGDPLTVTAATAQHGSVVRNADGTITYTPNTDYNGTDTINYTISDGEGGTSNATIAVTITPVNDAPRSTGTPATQNGVDAGNVSFNASTFFADPEGDPTTYAASGLPAGLVIDASSGVVSGTLGRSASQVNGGRYTIAITATDTSGAATTQNVAFVATNPAPTPSNDTATTAEDTAVIIDVLANDSDPDGDPLTVTAATAAHGSVTIGSDGRLTYTPDADFNGTDTIDYTVSDGEGGTAIAHVAVNITPVNDAPRAKAVPPSYAGVDGAVVDASVVGAFYDPDGDQLTYTAAGLPTGLTLDSATGRITGTLGRSASQQNGGVYAITLTATDPSNQSAMQQVTLTVTNPAPVAGNDTASTAEDTPVTIPVLANDRDPDGDPLTVTSASAQHGTVVRNADNTLTYTPTSNYNGSDTITYTIDDGEGGRATGTVDVTITPVNDAPVSQGTLPDRAALDGDTVSYPTASGFSDADGDTLSYAASGLPAGLSIDSATGIISGRVDRSASQPGNGLYAVTVTAIDRGNVAAVQRFAIQVTNPGPTARDDTATVHVDTPKVIAVLANDTDPDGDPLIVTTATALHGTVEILADNTLRYTPGPGYTGSDTIDYAISDQQGGTSMAHVAVDVTNAAPTHGTVQPVAANDGQSVSIPLAASFSDPDGDPLTYNATGLPPGLSIDPATGVVSGTIAASASRAPGGIYDAIITASDNNGGSTSAPQRWTIANPAPTAANDSTTTAEDTPVTIAVLANDTDPDGDALSVTDATAGHGRITINPDNTLTYTPDANYNGPDTIMYSISDGEGGRSNAMVAVTVTAVNDAPTTTGLAARTTQDNAQVSVPTAPAFDDADHDTLHYAAAGLPAGLSIDPATGIISGTITPGGVYGGPARDGIYHVVVTATDPSGGSVDARFDWTIAQVGPTARDDSATTSEDRPVTVDVLGNDSDPNGDRLTIVDAMANHGTVSISGGLLTFTPSADFNGLAMVTYTVADPSGNRSTATLTIDVTPVNDAPTAQALPTRSAADGASVALDTANFFADPDGDTLTYAATDLPAGLSIDPVTGRISGVVDRAASQVAGGVYHVTVTATDPAGASASSSFDWRIANPAPVAADDTAATAEDRATTIAVLGNDVDPDGDPLTVVSAHADHGTVAINADGTLTYTPDADFNGNDLIAYAIDDGNGGRADASVLVTVTPVNDAPNARDDSARVVEDRAIDIAVLANDSDVDRDALIVTGARADHGVVTINADGTLHYVPDADFNGTDTLRYSIADGQGGSADASVAIVVVAANDAPVAAPDSARTSEDTPVVIRVLANDTDVDGDPLTVTSATADHGIVAIGADGTLTYTPAKDFNGTDTITYAIADGQGGTATAVVTVTVAAVNDAPRATQPTDAIPAADATPITIDAGSWFADVEGDTLTYVASGLPAGLSIDPATGRITGTPDRSASMTAGGVYDVTVTATDSDGASGTASFAIRVANPAPVANDDGARTSEGQGITIPALANDRDPDGDPLSVTAASAANGTVTINADGSVGYVPGPLFAGTDTIHYTISDGQGGTASATVTVVVDPVNHAPVVATGDPVAATGGRPLVIDALGLVTDRDGDPLKIVSATSANGVVIVNRDGTLTFTPALGFVGTTTIGFRVADDQGGSTSGTIVVRVADGRGADIEQLLRIGRVSFRDPTPSIATVVLADGLVRSPLSLIDTVENIRSLRSTGIGDKPVLNAVEAIRSLRTTTTDPDAPIAAEVARLDAIRDLRDSGDRLFDQRWGDFLVKGMTGFSAAADQQACVMVESVVRGGAIYLEVRDTAAEGQRAPIRSVDVRMSDGRKPPDWIKVDPRGLAIIERAADTDELHLIVRVTREDGRTSATPIVVQGATGEVELDRTNHHRQTAAQPLDATLTTPAAAVTADAARLDSHFS